MNTHTAVYSDSAPHTFACNAVLTEAINTDSLVTENSFLLLFVLYETTVRDDPFFILEITGPLYETDTVCVCVCVSN